MFCMNCGTQMPDTAKFCPKCGARTDNAPAPAPVQEAKPAAPAPAAPKAEVFTAPAAAAAPVAATAPVAAAAVAATTAAAVTKTVSKGKRFVTLGIILAIALVIFTVYFTSYIDTPDEIVDRFFTCYARGDINGMMECAEPKVGSQLNAALGIGSSLLGIAGLDIDLGDLVGIAPIFSEYLDLGDYNPDNYEVVGYEGNPLAEALGGVWNAVGNALGEEAVVEFDMDNIHGGPVTGIDSSAERVRVRTRVINCGKDGWRLPEDMTVEYVRDVY